MVAKRKRNGVIKRPRRVGKRRVRFPRRKAARPVVGRILGKRRLPGMVGRSSKRMRMKRTRTQTNGPRDVTISKVTYGPRVLRTTTRQLAKTSTITRIMRIQQVASSFGGQLSAGTVLPGALDCSIAEDVRDYIKNQVILAGDAGKLLPVYLCCLNQTDNGTVNTGNAYQYPMRRLRIANNGDMHFVGTLSQDVSGVTGMLDWVPEYVSEYRYSSANPHRYIQNMWYSVRLMLYGARAQQTTWEISYVSFQPGIDPWQGERVAGTVMGLDPTYNDRALFWQQLVRSSVTNPVLPRDFSSRRRPVGMIVHKRLRYVLGSTDTGELNANPPAKLVNLYIKDGNVYDYDNGDPASTSWTATDRDTTWADPTKWNNNMTSGSTGQNVTVIADVPKPRARKYLMIRCTDYGGASAAGVNFTPSFDFVIRKREQIIAGA